MSLYDHTSVMLALRVCVCVCVCLRAGSEVMYGFSKFVCSLNEPEEGMAPTDSRHRPDVRTMEKQDFDSANTEKVNPKCSRTSELRNPRETRVSISLKFP